MEDFRKNNYIRGGLKRISSAYFTETLFYGNEASRTNALLSSTGYKAAYNGNIATKITEGLKRSGNNRANTYQYNYKYDQADRLTGAVYYNSNGEKFSTTGMTYDRNGNMLTLSRQGITQKLSPVTTYNTGTVDELTYVYDGNRLSQILDANSTSWPFDGIQSYLPLLNPVFGNIYNSNGALVFSGDQGLNIENNLLNLPKRIEDLDNNVVEIVYDASGQKVSYTDHSNSSQNKIYHRGMIYKNGELSYVALPEGYYDGNSYYATISDYLGSVRVVLKDNPTAFNLASEVMEINHYDPWGIEFGMSEDPFGVQDFKHQGKERMNLLGKNVHDHGARLAFDGRWGSPDPLQEIFYSVSPYVYCNNNPIRFIDSDGRFAWTPEIDENKNILYKAEKGDNLSTFMSQYGLTESEAKSILEKNNLSTTGNIKEGSVVTGESVQSVTNNEVLKLDWSSKEGGSKQKRADQIMFAIKYGQVNNEMAINMKDFNRNFQIGGGGLNIKNVSINVGDGKRIPIVLMSIGFTYKDTEVRTTGEGIRYIQGTSDFKHEYRNGTSLRNPKSKRPNLYLRINNKYENAYSSFYYKNY